MAVEQTNGPVGGPQITNREPQYVVVDPMGTPIGLPKATIEEAEKFRELYGRTWLPLVVGTDDEASHRASMLTIQPVHQQESPIAEQPTINGTQDDQKHEVPPPTSTAKAGYVDVFTYVQRYRTGELTVQPNPPHTPTKKVKYNMWG